MPIANSKVVRLLIISLLIFAAGDLRAENWPQWRGPTNNCVSQETGIPAKFSKTENVAWRLPLPGQAGSTPIVWGNRIFLTSADGNDLVLFCCSTDGKPLWKKVVASGNKAIRADEGNLASPSPSTDGKHVWCYFGTGDMACYDFDGNEVWKFNLQDRYKKFNFFWGMHVTPLLDGDRLYMSLIYTGSKQVVALDKNTGAEIWSAERPSDARAECEQSYASPIIYRDAKQEFLLTHGADYDDLVVGEVDRRAAREARLRDLSVGRRPVPGRRLEVALVLEEQVVPGARPSRVTDETGRSGMRATRAPSARRGTSGATGRRRCRRPRCGAP